MRRLHLPPGPVVLSLTGTLLMVYLLAAVLVQAASGVVGGIDPVVSFVWRLGFVTALLWIDLHRRRMREFLAALGVSGRGIVMGLLPVYLVLEYLHGVGLGLLSRAGAGG